MKEMEKGQERERESRAERKKQNDKGYHKIQ